MIQKTPRGFEEFRDIMIRYYVNNLEKYRKFLEKRMTHDGDVRNLKLYNMCAKLDYSKVYEKMLLLYSEFEELYK